MEVRAVADEYYGIPENPQYSAQIRALRNDDPANAEEIFNPLFARLIENTAAVKKLAEGKQNALAGAAGQVVGFDAQGKMAAINMPEHITLQQVNNAVAKAVNGAIEGAY